MKGRKHLPSGWAKELVGNLFDVQLGKMLNEKAKEGEQHPYLANFNVRWGKFDLERLNSMAFSEREQKKYTLHYGDLLVCEGGEIGRCAVWKINRSGIYYQKALHRIRSKNEISSTEYFYFYMQYLASKRLLLKLVGETSIAHLTREKLLGLTIPLPPLPEQKAIADLLATWDEAIEKTKRLIQEKERRFKRLLRELISEPRNTRKDAEWKKVKLDDLFGKDIIVEKGKVLSKKAIAEGDIPVVAGGQSYAYFTNVSTHDVHTVTVSASGAYAGYVWFHDYPIWASDCNVLYAVNGSTAFLYFALKAIQSQIFSLQSGGAQPHVYSKDLKLLTIPWPSDKAQQQIANILFSATKEINLLKQIAEKYKIQKRSLMQKMLTGKWRVKPEIVNQYMGSQL